MKASRSLLISCALAFSFGHLASAFNHRRQAPGSQVSPPAPIPPLTTASPPTSTEQSTTSSAAPTSASPTSSSTPPPSSPPAQSTPNTPTTSATSSPPPPPTSTAAPPATSQLPATDSTPVDLTTTITTSGSATSDAPATASTTGSNNDSSGGGSGLGVGSIIGMSVAGGIAVIAIIGFFVWKLTRKRFSDFDDNEAIKWPELNAHGGNTDSHPLPVHNTGRSGFDTGSEVSLSRAPSTSNYSTPDVGGVGPDPYAVPPLPHLNPNQPYRDDPTAASGYYDPYRGPVPGTLENGVGGDWGGEAIPMTQMAGGNAGRMSPGPQAAYGGEHAYDGGRRSPGPQAAYGGGRASPGSQVAYGGGRASPGPQGAYGAGRTSPGPQAAYDLYGAR